MRRLLLLALVVATSSDAAAQHFGGPVNRFVYACDVPESPLPPTGPTLSRTAVVDAMNAISPAIDACSAGSGTLQLAFGFRGSDGAATEVHLGEVTGYTPSDAELRCMEEVGCTVRLPPFERATFTVNFPFRF